MAALTAAILAAIALLGAPPDHPLLVFRAHTVLNDQIYRAILDLPPGTAATPGNAMMVRRRLLSFLRRAGYDLATVDAHIAGDQIVIDLDEGRLDKIIFIGQGALETLELRLALDSPENVFNRKMVDRKLREVSAQFGLKEYRWHLVPVDKPEQVGVQIEQLEPLPNVELIPVPRPYELHIELSGKEEWGHGLTPEVTINGLEGLGLGVLYRDRDLFLPGDRWETRMRLAGLFRETLDQRSNRLVLSAALLEGRWYTPSFFGEKLRTFFWLRGYLLNRQRGDLALEGFFHLPIEASIDLELEASRYWSVFIGGGIEHRRIFGVVQQSNAPVSPIPAMTPDQQTRPFGVLNLALTLNPEQIRRDRRHEIDLEGRLYGAAEQGRRDSQRVSATYQKQLALGWDELWIKSHGVIVAGDILYPDEEATGSDYLRGPFSGAFYVRKIAAIDLEFRYSLVRDLFKVSVFHDLAGFGEIDRARDTESLSFANAFGLGLHVLLVDAFQLDVYGGVGFGGGRTDSGVVLQLRQAY